MAKLLGLLLTFAFPFFLLSCNKSGSGTTSNSDTAYLTCVMDGVSKSFNNAVTADTLSVAGINSIEISGFTNNSNKETLHLDISNSYEQPGQPIVTGTYTDTSSRFDLSSYYLLVINADSTAQFEAGTVVAGQGDLIVNHLNIVVTSIAGGYIAGTFSGDYFSGGDPKAAKKAITGGQFYAKLQ
ncbi:MAG: hypothetical protein P4L51_19385 [Puia sp.]|nr:hypothetical protein [Puia sp.]